MRPELKLWTHAALDPAASSSGGRKSPDDATTFTTEASTRIADAISIGRARAALTRAIRAHPKLALALLPIDAATMSNRPGAPARRLAGDATEFLRAAFAGVKERCASDVAAAVVAAANGVFSGRARGEVRDSRAGCVGGCGGGDVRRRGEGRARRDATGAHARRRIREPPVRARYSPSIPRGSSRRCAGIAERHSTREALAAATSVHKLPPRRPRSPGPFAARWWRARSLRERRTRRRRCVNFADAFASGAHRRGARTRDHRRQRMGPPPPPPSPPTCSTSTTRAWFARWRRWCTPAAARTAKPLGARSTGAPAPRQAAWSGMASSRRVMAAPRLRGVAFFHRRLRPPRARPARGTGTRRGRRPSPRSRRAPR